MKRHTVTKVSAVVLFTLFVAACSANTTSTICLAGHNCESKSSFSSTPAPGWGFSSDAAAATQSISSPKAQKTAWVDPLRTATTPQKKSGQVKKESSSGILRSTLSTTTLLPVKKSVDRPPMAKDGHLLTGILLDISTGGPATVPVTPQLKSVLPKKSKKSPSTEKPAEKRTGRTDCGKFPKNLVVSGC